MTTYTFNLGAGGLRTVALDKNACSIDGEPCTQLEALKFLQDANAEGLTAEVEVTK